MTTSRIAVWLSRTANELRRWAFRPMLPCLVSALWAMFIPGLASAQSAETQGSTPGVIQGTVKDGAGLAVPVWSKTEADSADPLLFKPF
jgi:hypothetical protein